MNRGQACRSIEQDEDDAWEGARSAFGVRQIAMSLAEVAKLSPTVRRDPAASSPEAWSNPVTPVPESGTRPRRSSAETRSVSDPVAALISARPDWCVDIGSQLLPMTTFELWSATERGEVAPWMRVWREGMERWTPVQDVPELRWAVACVMNDATVSLVPPEALPTPPAPANEAWRASPIPPEVTPAPVATRSPEVEPEGRGAGWLATGSVVAVLAICAALVRSTAAAAPVSAAAVAPAATSVAVVADAPASGAQPAAAEEAEARPAIAGTRREERGQRRLPRGGRRAQGR